MPFLPPKQQLQSTEGTGVGMVIIIIIIIIIQRLSMLIQRFNSALITDSFCFSDEHPDL